MSPKSRIQSQGRRPLEKHWKDCIIGWHDDDKSYQEIVELLAQQNIHTSRSTVARVLKKKFIPREYRPTSIKDMELYASIRDTVIRFYLDDSQSTLQSVAATSKLEFNEEISVDVVLRIREESGFHCYNTRYGHSVRIVNRLLRLAFCREQIEKDNMFPAHVFTDECCVQLSANNRFVFCLRGDVQRRVKSVHKNPVQVMIWGGISWRGTTPLVMFDTYSRLLTRNGREKTFGEHVYLIQDNAPSHTAARIMEYLEREQIKTIDWPPESPEINAVEVVWANLKRWLQDCWKPTNLSHLKEGIATWWKDTLTPEKCKEFIRRVQPQMRKVIENEGAPFHD